MIRMLASRIRLVNWSRCIGHNRVNARRNCSPYEQINIGYTADGLRRSALLFRTRNLSFAEPIVAAIQ